MFHGRIGVMMRGPMLIGLGIATLAAAGVAAERPGVDPRFAPAIATRVGGQPVRLVLTGTAVRTKYMLSVYTIGSYVQEGVKVHDAAALIGVAAPKQLHLIFERNVDGATIAESFREAIGMSHPAPAFATELARLDQYFRAYSAHPGDHVWLTHIPGTGLACQFAAHPMVVIENVAFAQAAWEVYLGRKNLGTAIQSGLTSRL
jgi:Chalcone isomerase-like